MVRKKIKLKKGICKMCGHSIRIAPNGSWYHTQFWKHLPETNHGNDCGCKK